MNADEPGMLTDLYQLTMAQSYFQQGMSAPAIFSLFIREYPPNRAYFVSAGLEDVLKYLEGWQFPKQSVDYLRSTGIFAADFLDYLTGVRFTGELRAVPEGRMVFADEPFLEVMAPIIEAQIVETLLINQINLQSLVATKASRCVWAAGARPVVDFSLRRTHGVDAGMKVARASYITGCQATSNVLAGKAYGVPISGTMAHSFVSSQADELEAFRAFAGSFPDRCTLLIDTYDTIEGSRKAAVVGKEMEARGQRLSGVRLDSGALDSLSRQVRDVLDRAGLDYVNIAASGGLDEFEIEELVSLGAPIDGFGVGTKMGVSADAPWTDMAYKLVRYDGRPVTKLSPGKGYLPGEKQVFRTKGSGTFSGDVIALKDESVAGGEPVLQKVMEAGKTIKAMPGLEEIRSRFKEEFSCLEDRFKALRDPPLYPVSLSPGLRELHRDIERDLRSADAGRSFDKLRTSGPDDAHGELVEP